MLKVIIFILSLCFLTIDVIEIYRVSKKDKNAHVRINKGELYFAGVISAALAGVCGAFLIGMG